MVQFNAADHAAGLQPLDLEFLWFARGFNHFSRREVQSEQKRPSPQREQKRGSPQRKQGPLARTAGSLEEYNAGRDLGKTLAGVWLAAQ